MTTGLVLSGGGARAAYQVGVLKAVSDILPGEVYNPFPIVSGISAGAINAMALVGRPGHFRRRMNKLYSIWSEITTHQIYRSDIPGILLNTLKILYSFMNPWYSATTPLAVLDNQPLRELLDRLVRFRHIDEALASGELQALAITAMSYSTGQSVTFFQGNRRMEPWSRARRTSMRTGLTIDHLLASSALPAVFPATKIDRHYYGDGALRLQKPLSPVLHLGAERIFVIGVSDNPRHKFPTEHPDTPPSLGNVVGHLLSSVFIDTIEGDMETLATINRLVKELPAKERIEKGLGDMKAIDLLSISPSEPIDLIAKKHIKELPRSVRLFLYATGSSRRGEGSSLASYLLFEKSFCLELLKLGYKDALEQKEDILNFFGMNGPEPGGSDSAS